MAWTQSVENFLTLLASADPAPGGGASSALAGALGAAQLQMVCSLALASPRFADDGGAMAALAARLEEQRSFFLDLADADAEAYGKVAEALKMPRTNDDERRERARTLAGALSAAADVPLAVMNLARRGLALCGEVAGAGPSSAASDVAVAAALFRAATDGAAATVLANTHWMADRAEAERLESLVDEGRRAAAEAAGAVTSSVEGLLR